LQRWGRRGVSRDPREEARNRQAGPYCLEMVVGILRAERKTVPWSYGIGGMFPSKTASVTPPGVGGVPGINS